MLIGISDKYYKNVESVSKSIYEDIKAKIKTKNLPIILYKPVPAPIDKIKNKYRWRIIIKGIMTENANEILNEYLQKFYNCTYKNTKVTIEINPNNMM